MIPVFIFINGIRRAGFQSWPAVPRRGDSVSVGGTVYKVVRVVWIADEPAVNLYLKSAAFI